MLKELKGVHRARNLAIYLTPHCRFVTMEKKTDETMLQWIAEVGNLVQCLSGIGVTVKDEDIILALTVGLSCA